MLEGPAKIFKFGYSNVGAWLLILAICVKCFLHVHVVVACALWLDVLDAWLQIFQVAGHWILDPSPCFPFQSSGVFEVEIPLLLMSFYLFRRTEEK